MQTKITKCTEKKSEIYGSKAGSICQCLFLTQWQVTVMNVLAGQFLPVKEKYLLFTSCTTKWSLMPLDERERL